jgi:hypothetical protein
LNLNASFATNHVRSLWNGRHYGMLANQVLNFKGGMNLIFHVPWRFSSDRSLPLGFACFHLDVSQGWASFQGYGCWNLRDFMEYGASVQQVVRDYL